MAQLGLHGADALSANVVAAGVTVASTASSLATVPLDTVPLDIPDLVEREAPALLAYFIRRLDSREDAADLLGETLVIVWRRKSAIPGDETRARMWLYGVARKVLAGHRRGSRRRVALTDRLRDELVVAPTGAADAVAGDEVRRLLEGLPELDREIVRLAYWEGFSLAEVAGILGLRPGTVRSRHSRAMAKLRVALEGADSD